LKPGMPGRVSLRYSSASNTGMQPTRKQPRAADAPTGHGLAPR
jgi:hypothetical protein